jgi:hypothetical protein
MAETPIHRWFQSHDGADQRRKEMKSAVNYGYLFLAVGFVGVATSGGFRVGFPWFTLAGVNWAQAVMIRVGWREAVRLAVSAALIATAFGIYWRVGL